MRTTDEIYREMKTAYEQRTGLALNDGGDMAVRLYAVAAQICALSAQSDYVNRQAFPQLADGAYLDYHAQMRGLERTAAVKAVGSIRFSIPEALESDLGIAEGLTCATQAGVEFITTCAALIPAGETSCLVSAEALLAGAAGNVPAGSVTLMEDAPTGVAGCVNDAEFYGGSDTEDDESLRARILESYSKLPNGANKAYYQSLVTNMDGVEAVSVLPKARGLSTVDIIFTTDSGVPTAEQIAAVQAKLNEQREICVDVNVYAPEIVEVDITVEVDPEDGYEFEDVAQRVSQALTDYFGGSLLGQNILRVRLGSIIFAVEGVGNYKITAPAEDVAITAAQLAVPGSVTVAKMD